MSESDGSDSDPSASLLTPSQRRFLRGEANITQSAQRAMRSRINARFKTAAELDYPLVIDYLDRESRARLQDHDSQSALMFYLQPYVREIIEAPLSSKRASTETKDKREERVEYILSRIVERTFESEDPDGTYRISIDLDISNPEWQIPTAAEIEEQIQEGEIKPEKIRDLYDSGHISLNELTQLTRQGRLLAKDDLTDEAYRELLADRPDFLDEED